MSFIRSFLSAVAIAANPNRQRVDGAPTTANGSVGLVSRGRCQSDFGSNHTRYQLLLLRLEAGT